MPSTPPNILFPLRILVLSPQSTPLPPLLEDPVLSLVTPYYSASIPLWHDVLAESDADIRKWEEEWKEDAAREVIDALGACVFIFRKPVGDDGKDGLSQIRSLLTTISGILVHHNNISTTAPETLLLAVGMHQPLNPRLNISNEQWEDICYECGGWEWIDGEKAGGEKNEFKEKVGLERLREALEANEWTNPNASRSSLSDIDFLDTAQPGFGLEAAEVESEFKAAVHGRNAQKHLFDESPEWHLSETEPEAGAGEADESLKENENEGDNSQIEELEAMVLKMQAVKEKSSSLPEPERKKFAAKVVRDVMRRF